MRKLLVIGWLFVFMPALIMAQENSKQGLAEELVPIPQLEDEFDASFFAMNRDRLRDTLPDSSAVVLFSAPRRTRSNDISYPYHQDPDFYYFTGIEEENAMMVLFKNPVQLEGKWYREILFIEEKDPKKESWNGTMLDFQEAQEISGIGAAMPNTEFKTMSFAWDQHPQLFSNRHLFIEHDDLDHPGDLSSMVKHLYAKTERAQVPVMVNEGEDLFSWLRQQKQEEEIRMIKHAADITCAAHNQVMRSIKPGMTEYQLEALISYTFRYNGADGDAFPSIVASGDNGAIMHYTDNNGVLIPGDLVVIDIGAQYENYAADVTRTIPVSGSFSEEQAKVYQLVLDAQTVAIRYATKGYKFWTPHEEAYRTIGKGLIKLGIIKEWSEIGDYFIHGTSHYLGLDVHDSGVYSSLQPGEIITVEPGIYIPDGSPCDEKWWGIYVRIEDDVLITDGAARILSDQAPKTIIEIEALMKGDQSMVDN